VDASESGDAVNVAPGTYYENVQIDKSLTVKGAGASETIVDGRQSGSVFTVGKNNPDVTVTLSDMAIQGGTGTSIDLGGNSQYFVGGGIWNAGRLTVARSTISGNSASNGGGIYNYNGTVNLESGSIDHNIANLNGGGIYSILGTLIGNMSIVHDNTPDQINISVDWLPEV
jgi:hypothetical protein